MLRAKRKCFFKSDDIYNAPTSLKRESAAPTPPLLFENFFFFFFLLLLLLLLGGATDGGGVVLVSFSSSFSSTSDAGTIASEANGTASPLHQLGKGACAFGLTRQSRGKCDKGRIGPIALFNAFNLSMVSSASWRTSISARGSLSIVSTRYRA